MPYIPLAVAYQVRLARANLAGILRAPAPVYWNISRN